VLLALARGAGARGLSGMPVRRDIGGVAFLRPLLDVVRADTADACAELGLVPWIDPHNDDPRFTRSRVRSALPLLSELLGSGVVANLARTARLVAADTAALDGWAEAAEVTARDGDDSLDVATVAAMPAAIRTRVLRRFALRLGAPAGALAATHIDALDALVMAWRGQGPVALPGAIHVGRQAGHLRIAHGNVEPTYRDGSRGASSSSLPEMAANLLADRDME
jgi:tRNA(Ile)-lysidine synthase